MTIPFFTIRFDCISMRLGWNNYFLYLINVAAMSEPMVGQSPTGDKDKMEGLDEPVLPNMEQVYC